MEALSNKEVKHLTEYLGKRRQVWEHFESFNVVIYKQNVLVKRIVVLNKLPLLRQTRNPNNQVLVMRVRLPIEGVFV